MTGKGIGTTTTAFNYGAGFFLQATLPAGTYDLRVHARGTVGTFNNSRAIRIVVFPQWRWRRAEGTEEAD